MRLFKYDLLLLAVGCLLLTTHHVLAQGPDHPVITEVYMDPPGSNDGPVGRDPGSLHQEYIELYLPTCADLQAGLDCDALNLTFYEVEGDKSSSGLGLVNYRIDLPTFDLDAGNGLSGLPRPARGVVVLGWVDYNAGVTDLLGTPDSRVGLIDGGIVAAPDYTFIAMNGDFGSGTTNFPTPGPGGESSIDENEGEASSGIMQNGSNAYLLVNRDSPGYVELYDDEHVPIGGSANPNLPGGDILMTSALLDGLAGNDDADFDVIDQPLPACEDEDNCVDLQDVLPEGGAFSQLVAQIPEVQSGGFNPGQANGYARRFPDVAKTTENGFSFDDDPVADALNAYRHIRNAGPFFPSPGQVALSTSAPELTLAEDTGQLIEILSQTTGQHYLVAANTGGDFGIDVATSVGASSNPAVAIFASGDPDLNVPGQTLALPRIQITAGDVAHLAQATAPVTITASNSVGGDPAVLNPVHNITATARVLNPTTGKDANGTPFQTTVFVAVQGLVSDPAVLNEFAPTSLATHLSNQPDITALETQGFGMALLDPATNIGDPLLVLPWVKELPDDGEECSTWLNPPGPVGTLSFAETVINSAEVISGEASYQSSIGDCNNAPVIKAIRLNIPDTLTSGGRFTPSETVHFAGPTGSVGSEASRLTNLTTTRTFEVALVDTNLIPAGTLESGGTDDFGMLVEVKETEAGAAVAPGEFVFLSMTGGLQGADIDSLAVPPGNLIGTIVYLDLDNLHDVLGVRSIESVYIVDGDQDGEVDFVEAFSLNPDTQVPCPADLSGDGVVDALDLAQLLGAWGPNPGNPADLNGDGVVNASDLAQLLGAWGTCA